MDFDYQLVINAYICIEIITHNLKKYTVMTRLLFFISMFWAAAIVNAQTSDFATMKAQLNSSSIPLVNIMVDESLLNKDTYVSASIEIADPQKRTENLETATYLCTVRYRGASSLAYDKKSFNLKLVDETGADLDLALFGIRAENSWMLDAMTIDRARMRNRVCFDIWNDISKTPYETKYANRNGADGLHVELFLNGSYHGLYCLGDKVDRKLLGLKKAKVEGTTTTTRGILYKCNDWTSGSRLLSYDNADMNSATWNAWELQYPNDYADATTWTPLTQLIDFCSSQTTDASFAANFNQWFYIDNLADYFTFVNALGLRDTGWKNTFLSVPNITEGHRFLVSPWDMDASIGGDKDGTYVEDFAVITQFDNTAPFNRLRQQNTLSFNDLCKERWQTLSQTIFAPSNFNARIDAVVSSLTESGAWAREVEKWNNNPVELKSSLAEEAEYIKQWYAQNIDNLNEQWGLATGLHEVEGETSAANQYIFTLDGRRVGEIKDGYKYNKSLKKGIYIIGGKKINL